MPDAYTLAKQHLDTGIHHCLEMFLWQFFFRHCQLQVDDVKHVLGCGSVKIPFLSLVQEGGLRLLSLDVLEPAEYLLLNAS